MADTSKDAGLIQVLAKRLETQRLPWALSLKEKVDRGETLTDFDIQSLTQVFEDAQQIGSLVDHHPAWHDLATKLVGLYKEITDKGLENEKAKSGSA